jgi:hypothetical protein
MTKDNKIDDAKEALKRDWEQTKSDMPGMEGKDLDQDAHETVKQAAGAEEVPNRNEKTD